jgi:DNA-binding GntR family transcriptional regulator
MRTRETARTADAKGDVIPLRLSDRAYEEIRRQIIELALRPGTTISERELSVSLCHTKASVRAALLRLAQEKLVQPIARQGYFVSPLTIKDAREILDLRLALEPMAAFHAAGRINRSELRAVEGRFSLGYTASKPETYSAFLRANKEYRLLVVKASGNDRLVSIVSNLLDELERYFRLCFITAPHRSDPILEVNKEISASLVEGRPSDARKATERLLELARSKILGVLSERDEVMTQPLRARTW